MSELRRSRRISRGHRYRLRELLLHIPIHANLLPLLRAMHVESKGEGRVLKMPSERTMARALRRWLRRAGVTRDDLFEERSATLKPIRWHDMRATGITWSIIAGVDPIKVQHRAGHTDPKMTAEYTREAESFAGQAFGEPFPALPLSSLGVPSGGGGSSNGGGGGPVHRALAGSAPGTEVSRRTGQVSACVRARAP